MKLVAIILTFITAGAAYAAGDAHGGGPSPFTKDFLFRIINFVILFGGLGYLLAKPLKNFLKTRKETIENAIMEARRAKEDAEKKAVYYEEKMASLDSEVTAMIEEFKREAEEERKRIVKDSADQLEKMRERMLKSLEQEKIRIRQEVTLEAAEMAVRIAGELLQKNFTPADQKKWVEEYTKMMERVH